MSFVPYRVHLNAETCTQDRAIPRPPAVCPQDQYTILVYEKHTERNSNLKTAWNVIIAGEHTSAGATAHTSGKSVTIDRIAGQPLLATLVTERHDHTDGQARLASMRHETPR